MCRFFSVVVKRQCRHWCLCVHDEMTAIINALLSSVDLGETLLVGIKLSNL